MTKSDPYRFNLSISAKKDPKINGRHHRLNLKRITNTSSVRFLHNKLREIISIETNFSVGSSKTEVITPAKVAVLQMFFCITGIYLCFALWSIKQERLMTKPYKRYLVEEEGWKQETFPSVLGVGFFQSLGGFVCAVVFVIMRSVLLRCTNISMHTRHPKNLKHSNQEKISKLWEIRQIVLIGLFSVLSSAFGFFAMRILPYPIVLAAKMSKMLPVMIIGFLWHGTHYPVDKVLSCFLITIGIFCFYLTQDLSEKKKVVNGNTRSSDPDVTYGTHASPLLLLSEIGFTFLFCSLILDGFISSTQDVLVKQRKWSGLKLMLWGNLASVLWSLALLIVFEFVEPLGVFSSFMMHTLPAKNSLTRLCSLTIQRYENHFISIKNTLVVLPVPFQELSKTVSFLEAYPRARLDLFLLTFFNSVGQLFVFYTIYLFGTLTLTAMTVTRKVGSVMLSVIIYGHSLKPLQWLAFAIISVGVVWEGLLNIRAASSLPKNVPPSNIKGKTVIGKND